MLLMSDAFNQKTRDLELGMGLLVRDRAFEERKTVVLTLMWQDHCEIF